MVFLLHRKLYFTETNRLRYILKKKSQNHKINTFIVLFTRSDFLWHTQFGLLYCKTFYDLNALRIHKLAIFWMDSKFKIQTMLSIRATVKYDIALNEM